VPDDLERGDWLVVFSRPDCDHCQALYREHFAAPRKDRVLKVSILDSMGTTLAMPCEGCFTTSLYRVKAGQPGTSPNYLIQTPVIVRLKDGVVTDVCSDVDKQDDLARILGDSSGPSAPVAVDAPKPAKPTAPAWPARPAKMQPFYVAEFADAIGKPLAANLLSPLIAGVPADFQSGRWIVVFYREDCDHCHELLGTYFTGKLPVRTLAVAIPDADPNALLDNPCDECVKVSLLKGPNYVIQTPVVLAVNDGIVECVVENAEDMQALEACLKFPKK
jgi:glutaredoxin